MFAQVTGSLSSRSCLHSEEKDLKIVCFIGSMEIVNYIFFCFKLHYQVGCVKLVKVFLYFIHLVLNRIFMSYQSWGLFGNVEFMIHLGIEFGVLSAAASDLGRGVTLPGHHPSGMGSSRLLPLTSDVGWLLSAALSAPVTLLCV